MLDISIVIEEEYYNKDPQSTELGKNIISASISLLNELGFEQFTFKKLAEKIKSTEASVYRYFDNKLKMLLYLTRWYWAWLEYQIDYQTHHIRTPEEKLKEILKILSYSQTETSQITICGTDTISLRRVVMSESDKTYLNKQVDEINSQGLFRGFKKLCHKIAEVLIEINPTYGYPHALVSNILETTHQQTFFANHLPSLTEISTKKEQSLNVQVYDFIEDMIFKVLKNVPQQT